MSICLRRREFIAGLGGAAAWPFAAGAQQGDRMRRIGLLMPYDENDPVYKSQVSAFTQALAGLGWTDGRNVRIDLRWAGDGDKAASRLAPKGDDPRFDLYVERSMTQRVLCTIASANCRV